MKRPRPWHWGDPLQPLRQLLERGGILAIPTESSYGLGVDPRNPKGVEAIYRLKRRERGKPLPLVAGERRQVDVLGVEWDEVLEALAALWPAPLSLVVSVAGSLPAAAGGRTVAVRIPAHDGLRRLLQELDMALTATSANRSGKPPVLRSQDAVNLLQGHDAVVIHEERLPGGPPSTVVAWRSGRLQLLRRGAFPVERLQGALERVASLCILNELT